MAVQITKEILNTITVCGDLLTFSRMEGDSGDVTTAAGSWLALLGAKASTPAVLIASLPEKDYVAMLQDWNIKTTKDETRGPSFIERSQAHLMGRAARLASGIPDPPSQTKTPHASAAPGEAASSSSTAKGVKLTMICPQND